MYAGWDVTNLFPEAEKFVMDNDRHLYDVFFVAAEKFCIEEGILIGGRVGIDLLIGAPLTKDSYFWELYTDNTFEIAKKFAEMLSQVKSPHVPARTVGLQTNIKHREFTIMINANYLFKVYSLDKYRGVKVVDVMKPPSVIGYFTGENINAIPDEIQLIDIYRTLYSPAKIKNWEKDLSVEKILYEGFRARQSHIVTGGANFDKGICDDILMQKLISGGKCILIGDYAANLWLTSQKHQYNVDLQRLQFITNEPVESLVEQVEKIIIRDKNAARKIGLPFGAKISFSLYNLNIPSDFQIVKYTLYANFPQREEQIPIADVFNSTEYELIPFVNIQSPGNKSKSVSFGNPFVLLKFIFIDIWVIRLIINMQKSKGSGRQEFLQRRAINLMLLADEIRKKTLKIIAENPLKIFQLENYAGVNINETVAKKKFIKELGVRFKIIYPAKKDEEK